MHQREAKRMSNITIDLPEERLHLLRERARHLGTTPEELIRLSINELLDRSEDEIEQAINYSLQKNAELYRRLA